MAEEEQAIHAAYGKAGSGVGATPGGPGKIYWTSWGPVHPNEQDETKTTMGDEDEALRRARKDQALEVFW